MKLTGVNRLALAVALALATRVHFAAQSGQADIPKLDVEKYTLANGLEVILSEDHRVPLVGVNLWYHVGPAYEAPGRTGFAHLFEHMMFQGSKHVGNDAHFQFLSGAGASTVNGTTGFDRTNYFETLPSDRLELALWLESDRMGYMLDTLDQANLSNQQDVVRNERRQGRENSPYGVVDEALYQAIFPQGHPYHALIIGSHADIQAAELKDVRQFFLQYYAPNNATLVIAGDIDKAATRKLVEKYFSSLKRGPAVPPLKVDVPVIAEERRIVVPDRVELPRVYIAWMSPLAYKDGDAEAAVAAAILGRGTSSRLYKKLVYELQLAQSVSVSQDSAMLGSTFQIVATARPGHTPDELASAIDQELDRFKAAPPSQEEVVRARTGIETRMMTSLQSLGGFGGVADRLNEYNHYLKNPDYLAQDVTRYRNVTAADVQAFGQKYLSRSARVVVYGVPGQQKLAPEPPNVERPKDSSVVSVDLLNADEPWRSTPPTGGGARGTRVPVPQSFRMPNGLTVIALPQPGVAVVSAALVVRSGSDANPVDRPGLAGFTAAVMREGTTSRNALQIADDIAQIGATLSVRAERDSMSVETSSLSRNFGAALGLLADVALRPSFPTAEIERVRSARLASLAEERSDPFDIASNVMGSALYGAQHPYGFSELGTQASVSAISADQLRNFWRQAFVPGHAALIVSGAVTIADLRRLVAETLGNWAQGTPYQAPKLPAPPQDIPKLIIVDRPGSAQTQLRVATLGVARSNPDYVPLRVMNTILGGMFSSRINMNLREEHGYTYGARSDFDFSRSPGPFAVRAGVRTAVTAPAVHEIVLELKRIADSRVTADELTLAKDAITRSLPASFETTTRSVGNLAELFTYNLPLNYYANFPEQVSVVDAQAVQDAARKHLTPNRFVVVAVGDRAIIGDPLETEVGTPADLRDPNGNRVK